MPRCVTRTRRRGSRHASPIHLSRAPSMSRDWFESRPALSRHRSPRRRRPLLAEWLEPKLLLSGSPDLVAAYSFDQGAGTTVADLSGNGNNGTISGATWTGAGKYGRALAFNGTGARVNIN